MHPPDPERLPMVRTVDMGASELVGVGRYPALEGAAYPALVAAVDDDGNETVGIVLPDVAVPVATHAGWNPRDPSTGAPEQIVLMDGLTLTFARDADERERTQDPRPAIAERYANRADYAARVTQHCAGMVAAQLLLPEDAEVAAAAALESYDRAVAAR
jgi:hypothetical protein